MSVCTCCALQYIHDYCEVSESGGGFHHRVYSLASWCFGIALNTFECLPHVCPQLMSDGEKRKPSLRRQLTVESFGSDDANSLFQDSLQVGHDAGTLTPVPEAEDLEGSKNIRAAPRSRVVPPDDNLAQSVSFAIPVVGRGSNDLGPSVDSRSDPPDAPPAPFIRGRCVVCGSPTNEFSEEVMALCAVVIGTYCNRLPHVVPRYLVSRIIPALTK